MQSLIDKNSSVDTHLETYFRTNTLKVIYSGFLSTDSRHGSNEPILLTATIILNAKVLILLWSIVVHLRCFHLKIIFIILFLLFVVPGKTSSRGSGSSWLKSCWWPSPVSGVTIHIAKVWTVFNPGTIIWTSEIGAANMDWVPMYTVFVDTIPIVCVSWNSYRNTWGVPSLIR